MKKTKRLQSVIFAAVFIVAGNVEAAEDPLGLSFLKSHCADCHADGSKEGGFELKQLGTDLSDRAELARWVRLFDRIEQGEMPPADALQPPRNEKQKFLAQLKAKLVAAHSRAKGTVLRRLNRKEYQNTINDLFGTNLKLAEMLPEDGKSHEFDNVGESLGISMVHLQRYMDAATRVLETAVATTSQRPPGKQVTASYATTREGEKFIGSKWKKLPDGAVVRFSSGGYPSGMMRGTSVRESGRYRVKVRGYAYQSKTPITFSVGGTSFARGSEKPIYGFWSFPPQSSKPSSIEFEVWIERNYMVIIEPFGIADPDRYKRKSILDYQGPGLAILDVTLEGPLLDQWPSAGHRLIFDGVKRVPTGKQLWVRKGRRRVRQEEFAIQASDEQAAARQSLKRVAEALFRRPVNDEDIVGFLKLFQQQRAEGNTYEESIRTAVTAALCSSKFLYLQEPAGELDAHALASRLSYFLTRTAPDTELLREAKSGSLTSPKVLRSHTERLLKSRDFERFLVDFTDSWLDLRDIDFTVPDRKLFPEFDDYLRYSMPLETQRYLRELIESNLSITHLVKSDFAMLNSRLAAHYELPKVPGSKLRKVKLPPDSLRGGFLTQASILKVTANGTNTSPVTRGAWVMERILGTPPQPPPPGIPGVEPDIRGASTLRELLVKHRNVASCNACHKKIDPPGFALESFNPIGGYRARYRSLGSGERVNKLIGGRRVGYRLGPKVDSSGEIAGGKTFRDYGEFRDQLAARPERLAKPFVEKLLTFATGRELGFSDREEVERIVAAAAMRGFGVRDLVHLVVQSDIFRQK